MDEKKDFAVAEFPCSPPGPLKIHLSRKTLITENGFGSVPSIYPVTICPARYQGTYEGARWLCFPVHPEVLDESRWRGWQGSDVCCMTWWDQASRDGWPIGRGSSPDLAYQDLIERAGEKAGINPQDWVAEPTWDKDELGRRNDGLRG